MNATDRGVFQGLLLGAELQLAEALSVINKAEAITAGVNASQFAFNRDLARITGTVRLLRTLIEDTWPDDN